MSSDGLNRALSDLHCRLSTPCHYSGRYLSSHFEPKAITLTFPDVSMPTICFNHRDDYTGERILKVSWVVGENPAPFKAGSVMKIVYRDECVCLVDGADEIHFAADISPVNVVNLMQYIKKDTVKVLWYNGRLHLEAEGGFRQGFFRIEPKKLFR
jgi:hypothetical protein